MKSHFLNLVKCIFRRTVQISSSFKQCMFFPSCKNSTSSDFLLIAIEHDGLHGGSICALIDNISLPLKWKYFCIFIFQLSFIFSDESVYMMHIFWSKFCLPVCIKYQCTYYASVIIVVVDSRYLNKSEMISHCSLDLHFKIFNHNFCCLRR